MKTLSKLIRPTALALVVAYGIFGLSSVAFAQLQNPLAGAGNIQQIIGNVVTALLGITGSLALAVFVYGGFLWVSSGGNQEKISKGKDAMLWATLGLLVIMFAYAFVVIIVGAITGGESGGGRGASVNSPSPSVGPGSPSVGPGSPSVGPGSPSVGPGS